jgi:hypothetical protein
MATYDAFISYSHAADGRLAPALQSGLQRLARPWNKVRALRVFRDDTGLSVSPHLWGSIAEALDGSSWFVLLASPEAAASPWVNREIEHWLINKPADRILPVLTDGSLVWDPVRIRYDPATSASLPPALSAAITDEPRHLDLRWARQSAQLDLRHSGFRDAVADLAAPMHGIPKDELESEDVHRHRRAVRLARVAAAGLVVLLLATVAGGTLALENARRADTEAELRAEAEQQERIAKQERNRVVSLQRQLDDARADTRRQEALAQQNAAKARESAERAASNLTDAVAARADAEQERADKERLRIELCLLIPTREQVADCAA